MQRRVFAGAFAAGLPGVIAAIALSLPGMLAGKSLPMPLWAVQLVSILQSSVMLALAVWAGAALAPKVGLRAPVLSAWATRAPAWPAFAPQVWPGLLGGVAGATLLWVLAKMAPEALRQVQATTAVPAPVRILHGGITEELLLRWGVMTIFAWGLWRMVQRRAPQPSAALMGAAIMLSAVLFGVGHLPAAAALTGTLTPDVAAYIVLGNSAFGLLAGALYWKRGLEAAILAHCTAHALVLLAGG